MPTLVRAGSASTQATSPCARRRLQRLEIVEFDHARRQGGIHRWADVAVAGHGAAVAQGDERLVHRAVVTPVEHQDLRAPGDLAGEPDGEAVGVGGGEGELPEGKAEATRQLFSDPDGVLGREHEGEAAAGLGPDRVDRRGGCVSGHRAGVAQAEVEVAMPVHVGEVARPPPTPRRAGNRRATAPSSASARRRAASPWPARPARGTGDASRGSAAPRRRGARRAARGPGSRQTPAPAPLRPPAPPPSRRGPRR